MATEDRAEFGIAHPTVVPLNFEPTTTPSESDEEPTDHVDVGPPDTNANGGEG